jgi:hypothetical protein
VCVVPKDNVYRNLSLNSRITAVTLYHLLTWNCEGDHLFSKGEYIPSAAVYSQSDYSFVSENPFSRSVYSFALLTDFIRRKSPLNSWLAMPEMRSSSS